MRPVKRLLVLIFLVCVLFFGVLFSIQNTDQIALDLLLVQLPEQRLSLWVLLSFALGGVVGMLISAAAILTLKSQNLVLQRKLQKLQKELGSLRTSDFPVTADK
jgi:putative membrane protein